jgi:hypothetical protein
VQQAQGANWVEMFLNTFSDMALPLRYETRLLQGHCTPMTAKVAG